MILDQLNVVLCCTSLVLMPALLVPDGVVDSRGISESSDESDNSDVLWRQSSAIDVPDSSHYFAGAAGPIRPQDVRIVRGNFLPHHSFIFFAAWTAGPILTPWLYLPAFKLFITIGSLLHHERNFSYYQGRCRVVSNGRRYSLPLTLIFPHQVWHPESDCWLRKPLDSSHLSSLADINVPEVEINTYRFRQWVWQVPDEDQWTEAQAASFNCLDCSWAARNTSIHM